MPFGFISAIVGGATFATAAAAVTVVGTLEAVAAVGAVLSVVGVVTKNKTLSLVGAGLGLVGGIGALAAGALGAGAVAGGAAGAAGDTAAAAGTGGLADADLAAGAAGFGDAAAGGADVAIGATDVGTAATTAPDVVGALAGGADPAVGLGAAPAVSAAADPAETLTLASQSTNAADAVVPGTSGEATTSVAAPSASVATPSGVDSGAWGSTSTNPDFQAGVTAGKDAATPGAFDGILKFADAHPAIAFGAVQAGGSLLTGAFSTLTPAQVADLTARAAANDAAAALTRQQTANLAMPRSVASSSPVTGTPAALVPSGQPGLINQPQPIKVTGAV